jgi:hypothetical protein
MADMFGNEPDETIPQEQNPNYDNRPYDFNAPRDVNYQGLTSVQEDAVRRFGDLYGQGPEQNFALQGMQNVFGTIPRAQYDTETQASQLRRLGDRYLQGYMDRPSYTMATLERDYPDMYRRPEDVTTGDIDPYMERVTSGDIDPYLERVQTRGIDQRDISRFQDPFQQQVVRGALSEFDEGVDRAANMRRARQAGAGAFGSRTDLANQQVDADIARQRGNLASNLLSQGYGQALDTAVKEAGIGQQADIRDQLTMLAGGRDQLGRDLSAEQLNQAMLLRGGENQLARELRASQDRARNEMARTQFDVDSAYRGDQQRLGAIDRRQGLETDIAGLAQQRANMSGLLGGMGTDYDRLRGGMLGDIFGMGTAQFTQPFSMLDFSRAFFGNKGFEDIDTAERRDLERRTSETEGKSSFGFGF